MLPSLSSSSLSLEALEDERDEKRRRLEEWGHQKRALERRMVGLERDLERLDNAIDALEEQEQAEGNNNTNCNPNTGNPNNHNSSNIARIDLVKVEPSSSGIPPIMDTQSKDKDEFFTDPTTPTQHRQTQPQPQPIAAQNHHEDLPREDGNNKNNDDTMHDENEDDHWLALELQAYEESLSMSNNYNATTNHTICKSANNINNTANNTATQNNNPKNNPAAPNNKTTTTIDQYFGRPTVAAAPLQSSLHNTNSLQQQPPQQQQGRILEQLSAPTNGSSSSSNNTNIIPNTATHRLGPDSVPKPYQSNTTTINNAPFSSSTPPPPTSSSSSFPWSRKIESLLHDTFRIPSFRDQQHAIVNATLAGRDVFVIMRTGGGKSLTYQLPALYEGRHTPPQVPKKITFCISPLLSLIQDQEEQMNAFCPGSALSFSSAHSAAEQARRWARVRDDTSNRNSICLVLITPERVSKSNKLCAELDKLHAQQRLGRFVIDEAHCACQWGHDFRPDYALLGKLKSHFPTIPVMAVTATASDRVRADVCDILRLESRSTLFFRSTAHRPNLTYSVRPKQPDGTESTIIAAMATFIKEHYARSAGIVYTYSRKDADTVADALCDCGVIAEAYHSDVSSARKEMIHRSWMRNETQVVVATIAFGLGINKPDVRFVLHHSISKTLEAYYQESGRAGRDGNPAECVLYYSPKDVIRLLKMVHGTSSEHLLWPMIRYAQQSGNDAICKAIILTHLGEPNCPDLMQVVKENEGIASSPRDVGLHAQTVVKLLSLRQREGKDMTLAMLVKEWRSTGSSVPQFVKDNLPGKDDLTAEDCERIIVSLLLEKVFATNPIWNAYNTVIYFKLGSLGERMEQSGNPKFVIQLPTRDATKTAVSKPSKASTQCKSRKTVPKDREWLSVKPKASKTRKATVAKTKVTKKKASTKRKGATKKVIKKSTNKTTTAQRTGKKKTVAGSDVIELSSDDDDSDVQDTRLQAKVNGSCLRQLSDSDAPDSLWDDGDSDEEAEFEG